MKNLISKGIGLCVFDFAATGNSDGKYVSLGWYEAQDLSLIVDYLHKIQKVSYISLWGRSMGAVTALLYASLYHKHDKIQGMVLDSPFCSIQRMAKELVESYSSWIPDMIIDGSFKYIRDKI